MHEVKLGFKLQDYLSGKEIDATTYEDLRQDIVKMMVEEKGYPKDSIKSKVPITLEVKGKTFQRVVDFVVEDEEGPVLLVFFCAGEIETYVRECLAMGRLLPEGAAKLGIVTDTQRYILLDIKSGDLLGEKFYKDFLSFEEMKALSLQKERVSLSPEQKAKEERILYALSQLSCECRDTCNI